MNKQEEHNTFAVKSRKFEPENSLKSKNEESISKIEDLETKRASPRARAKMGAQKRWNKYRTKKNNFKMGNIKR